MQEITDSFMEETFARATIDHLVPVNESGTSAQSVESENTIDARC